MADGTPQNGTAIVQGDEVTTVNGGAVAASQAQRIKVDSGGVDGAHRDTGPSFPLPVALYPEARATFRGRASSFRIPGRAGTTGQKLFALHNATGSPRLITLNQLSVDLVATVVKAVTVLPPVIRVHRFTAVPTGGTAAAKVAKDSALASDAAVTAWGDASADGTSSAAALAVTIPANSMLTQEFAPRLITAAGYEMFDRTELLSDKGVVLRPLEGVVVFLDYVLATQNPVTDMWLVNCDWVEG